MATLTQYLPYDNFRVSNFTTWAQAIGTALSTFGWVKDTTVNGTVNWGTMVYSPNHDPTNSFPAQGTTTSRGAWSNASVTYSANDYVTSAGATWICRSGYTTTTSSPTPENEITAGSTQHWVLWPFEIWKSSTTPTIYLKFEYGGQVNATQVPYIRITVGTSDNTSANLGVGAGNVQSAANSTTPTGVAATNSRDGMYLNCYFSGDSTNRFAMLMWYGTDSFTSLGTGFFCVERSLTNTGSYYTTPSGAVTPYWTAIWSGYSNTNAMQSFVNTTGSTWILTTSDSAITTVSSSLDHAVAPEVASFTSGEGGGNASLPAFPIWPLVGWVGNPMTAAMSFKAGSGAQGDAPNASTFTVPVYGTTRTFICSRNNASFLNFGTTPASGTGNSGLAMRFD